MSEFLTYLRLGFAHIADLRGYDHILFIAALTAAYPLAQWRRLLVLVTAFTLGHSLTLALATLDVVRVRATLVEVLIPVTIVVASVLAVAEQRRGADGAPGRFTSVGLYVLAGAFGLVHGLGFSSYLRALLGGEDSIVAPLFAFNVGLELGQLLIVALVLALGVVAERIFRLARRDWILVLSGATAGVALTMIVDRLTAVPS